jgi:iron complex transport system substrate-binding protein
MRIISLLPSATEILSSLGLERDIVGVSHNCDYPPEVAGIPVVTRPAGGAPSPSDQGAGKRALRATDDEVGAAELDGEAIVALAPDLILTAADGPLGVRKLEAALIGAETQPEVVALDPTSLEGLLHVISTIGSMTESENDAIDLIEEMREDIGEIEQRVLSRQDQGLPAKRVIVLSGLDPLMSTGLWVPELIRRAGGWDVIGHEGDRPAPTSWDAILDIDPEMLVFAPIGLTLLQAQQQWRTLERPEFWSELDAVRRGQVIFVEPVYLNRPGPRIVDGIGMLAEIFDPEGFVDTSPPDCWTPLVELDDDAPRSVGADLD